MFGNTYNKFISAIKNVCIKIVHFFKNLDQYDTRLLICILCLFISLISCVLTINIVYRSHHDEVDTFENMACTSDIPTIITEPITSATTSITTTTITKKTTTTAAPTTTAVASNSSDVEMLACVIYQESGGSASCDNCRRYVGDVVLNRVNDSRFPNTIYGVLTQKNQYGRFYYTGIVWPSRANSPDEAGAVDRAYRVARELLSGNHSKLYGAGYVWQAEFEQGDDGFWCCDHFYGR